MKLKQIALTSIIILAGIVLGTEYLVSTYIVNKGFDDLERQQVAADVRRFKNEILGNIDTLSTFLWDWASWDDTYSFAQTGDDAYVESNLHINTFLEQNLNVVIIYGIDGKPIYARAINDEEDAPELLEEFQTAIEGVSLPQLAEGGQGGITVLADGPIMFAKRPILPSSGHGPAAGHMIMGRLFTDEFIGGMSKRLELPLHIHNLSDPGLPISHLKHILADQTSYVDVKDQETIEGYTLLRDIKGQPALLLDVIEERKISKHGRSVAHYTILFTGAVLIVFTLLIYYLLQKRVISRVVRLNRQVQNVGATGRFVTVDGDDEISQLAQNVNSMLHKLAEDQKALRTAHDDLEIKVAERTSELEEANQELLCLDKAKSHFLSSTSHELRTPLTAILGFIKLMERSFRKNFQPHLKGVDEATRHMGTYLENFKIVRLETERLGRLINDLLDLTKIEAGRIDWRDDELDACKLATSAANAITGQFNDNLETELVVDIPQSLPPIHADSDRIHQVLMNLLNNAEKFTDKGSVTLAVRETEDNAIEFSVADTGSGISQKDQDRIFDIFYQTQSDNNNDYYGTPLGTGLGLAICKEIVQHYGGRIWVESTLGEGSAFKFTIPLKSPLTADIHEA